MKTLRSLLLLAVIVIAGNVQSANVNNNNSDVKNAVAEAAQLQNSPILTPEVSPEFVGGEEALIRFIKNNLVYPDAAYRNQVDGKVTVRFVVTTDGTVRSARIVKGVGCVECDQEALRLVYSMPRWTPGQVNGKNVDCYYAVPISFRAK